MLNFLSPTDIHHLPILDQATLGILPEHLSIKEIAILLYSAESEQQYSKNALKCLKTALTNELIIACETKQLTYEGDIKGWVYTDTNPYPLARNGLLIPYHDPKLYMDFIRISVASTPIDTAQKQADKDQIPKSDIKANYYACSPGDCTIHRCQIESFFKKQNLWPIKNSLLARWWNHDDGIIMKPDSNNISQAKEIAEIEIISRLNSQVEYIIKVITDTGYNHLDIPSGGKSLIKKSCLNNSRLFTESAFKRAWIEANKRNLIRVHNKQNYCQRK